MVTLAGTEMSGGVTAPPAAIVNAAGIRTFVLGAVGLLCRGARFLGTSGGRELVVAVVVLGPALTVLVVVAGGAGAVELGELEEWLEPPQAAMSSATRRAMHAGRRGIGAL